LGAQPRWLVRFDTGLVASLGDLTDPRENPMSDTNTSSHEKDDHEDIMYPSSIAFILVHLACLGAIWSGITWQSVVICLVLYWGRIFAIGAGYHRYFAHRAYSTSRAFQFVLAAMSQSTAQKSVLWWASKHRHHHLYSDTQYDVHSPRHKGFLYSHIGWIFARRHDATDLTKIADFARYPELMWLHRYERVPAFALAVICFLVAGWPGLFVGFFWSTVFVFHSTFSINSLAHVLGKKRYLTGDDSRNNWLLALFTMGEGWHNNHHAYQSSVRQGFKWWEIDLTFYVLVALSWVGIVWDLKYPPRAVVRNEHRLGSRIVSRAAAQLAASFHPEGLAIAVGAALDGTTLATLREKLSATQQRAAIVLANIHLPHLPTRAEVFGRATAMFTKTSSMDEIVDRAHMLILDTICAQLWVSTEPALKPVPGSLPASS
jgi:stearoyl-CoA desaturase (delta-9 desaturase)